MSKLSQEKLLEQQLADLKSQLKKIEELSQTINPLSLYQKASVIGLVVGLAVCLVGGLAFYLAPSSSRDREEQQQKVATDENAFDLANSTNARLIEKLKEVLGEFRRKQKEDLLNLSKAQLNRLQVKPGNFTNIIAAIDAVIAQAPPMNGKSPETSLGELCVKEFDNVNDSTKHSLLIALYAIGEKSLAGGEGIEERRNSLNQHPPIRGRTLSMSERVHDQKLLLKQGFVGPKSSVGDGNGTNTLHDWMFNKEKGEIAYRLMPNQAFYIFELGDSYMNAEVLAVRHHNVKPSFETDVLPDEFTLEVSVKDRISNHKQKLDRDRYAENSTRPYVTSP